MEDKSEEVKETATKEQEAVFREQVELATEAMNFMWRATSHISNAGNILAARLYLKALETHMGKETFESCTKQVDWVMEHLDLKIVPKATKQ